MIPELIPVVSSNIAAVGYSDISKTLYIQFKGRDTVYEHPGVPRETHELMMTADSIGSFYARNVKKNYPSTSSENNLRKEN